MRLRRHPSRQQPRLPPFLIILAGGGLHGRSTGGSGPPHYACAIPSPNPPLSIWHVVRDLLVLVLLFNGSLAWPARGGGYHMRRSSSMMQVSACSWPGRSKQLPLIRSDMNRCVLSGSFYGLVPGQSVTLGLLLRQSGRGSQVNDRRHTSYTVGALVTDCGGHRKFVVRVHLSRSRGCCQWLVSAMLWDTVGGLLCEFWRISLRPVCLQR